MNTQRNITLVLISLISGLIFVAGCSQQGNHSEESKALATKEIVYSVPAMHCDGCVRSITDALNQLPGIDSVNVQLDNYTAYVRVDTTQSDAAKVAETIDGLGYTATRQ